MKHEIKKHLKRNDNPQQKYNSTPKFIKPDININKIKTTGYERPYEPHKWNEKDQLQYSTNCYAYALDFLGKVTYGKLENKIIFPIKCKPQPGVIAKLSNNIIKTKKNLDNFKINIVQNALLDAKSGGYCFKQLANVNDFCPPGTWKVALVVAPPKNDFHWYRQNPDGTWSHKPGGNKVTNLDASNKKIFNPKNCNRNYGPRFNYCEFVGFFAVGPSTNDSDQKLEKFFYK